MHEKLRISVVLSILADEWKHKSLLWAERIFCKKNFVVELYLNVMIKDIWQKRSWLSAERSLGQMIQCPFQVKRNADENFLFEHKSRDLNRKHVLSGTHVHAIDKPPNADCYLYGEWLLWGNCLLTATGNMIRPSEAELGQENYTAVLLQTQNHGEGLYLVFKLERLHDLL